MEEVKFQNLSDIEAFESTPIEQRMEIFTTYDLIKKGTAINPDATAISFFLSGDTYDQPMTVTYRDLTANITRTANLFHDLGIGPTDGISYLLPNLPHTHYVLWGGEAAGIVNPINPLLEPATIVEICQAAVVPNVLSQEIVDELPCVQRHGPTAGDTRGSDLAGDEGAWGAVAHPLSQRRCRAR